MRTCEHSHSSVVASWTVDQQVEPLILHLGHDSYKLHFTIPVLSLEQCVPTDLNLDLTLYLFTLVTCTSTEQG